MAAPFSYYNAIPQPGDYPANSQPLILTNFASIKSLIDVDHADFSLATAGKHNQVTLPVQASTPTFLATEFGIWNELDPTTGTNQIWLNNPTINLQVPWAESNIASVGSTGFRSGWFYVPSGHLIKFGTIAVPGLASTAINFPTADAGAVAIPAFGHACLGAVITNISAGTPSQVLSVQAVSTTQITVYNNQASTANAFFIAIGW